jgi:hypothetical protein
MTRGSNMYAVTGVIAAKCGRHGFIMPNGVADLSKGEKYVFCVFVSNLC